MSRRKSASPKTPLGRFLYDDWRDSELTQTAYASRLGTDRGIVRGLYHDKLPGEAVYVRLQAIFGESLPQSVTAEEALLPHQRQLLQRYQHLGTTPEARRKAIDSRRGKKRSPAQVAKMVASMPPGHYERLAEAIRAESRSPKGRAIRSLVGRLKGDPTPSAATIAEWAENVGDRLGLSGPAVRVIFREHMRRHGLATSPQGRRALEDRHRVVVQEMERRLVTASGRAPRGFWNETAKLVDDAEGRETLGGGTWLKEWYKKHREHCSDPALLIRGNN